MTDPAAPVASSAAVVNKAELAGILRTSLPTLDKMLRRHGEAFPVHRRGSNGRSYEFDPAAVVAFLAELEEARVAAGHAKDELMQQYTLPDIVPPTEPSLTPRDRLQLAKLRQLEREEQLQSGFLVERSAVRASLFTAFTSLRRDMGAAIRQELRRANIPEAVIRSVEGRIAKAQRDFVATTKVALRKPTEPRNGDQAALL